MQTKNYSSIQLLIENSSGPTRTPNDQTKSRLVGEDNSQFYYGVKLNQQTSQRVVLKSYWGWLQTPAPPWMVETLQIMG